MTRNSAGMPRRTGSVGLRWRSEYAGVGAQAWAGTTPTSGISNTEASSAFRNRSQLCRRAAYGTAYISAWLAPRSAHPVGIDNSPAQLATARRMQEQFGSVAPLFTGERRDHRVPDASFDLVVSEDGASIWCDSVPLDPRELLPLRPGATWYFLVGTALLLMLLHAHGRGADTPATESLERPSWDAPFREARRSS